MAIAFDVAEVVEFAGYLHAKAEDADGTLAEAFGGWVDEVADIMVDEIPVDQGDMRDSVTVERDGLEATIGPTNTDDRGRPIGFFVNYGAGNRPPNDFIGRTAALAAEAAGAFSVADVL
jgi:hypothetical protein